MPDFIPPSLHREGQALAHRLDGDHGAGTVCHVERRTDDRWQDAEQRVPASRQARPPPETRHCIAFQATVAESLRAGEKFRE